MVSVRSIELVLVLAFVGVLSVHVAAAQSNEDTLPSEGVVPLANRLLETRGFDVSDYSLARDNLAYFFVQGGRVRKIQTLARENPSASDDELVRLVYTRRWKKKVRRTLASPGTNQAIHSRLQTISEEFATFSEEVGQAAAGAEYGFILCGSLVKGHFSSHSDIDLIIDTKSEELAAWALSSPWSVTFEHPEGYDERVAIADAGNYSRALKKINLRLLGRTVAIEGAVYDGAYLLGLYRSLQESRGVTLTAPDFTAAYAPGNYLFRLERELPIPIVSAIEKAKNLREALANLFKTPGAARMLDHLVADEPLDVRELERAELGARLRP